MKKYLVFPCWVRDKEYMDIYRLEPQNTASGSRWYLKTDDSGDGFKVETVEKYPNNFLHFAKLKQAKEYWEKTDYNNRRSNFMKWGDAVGAEPMKFTCPSCGMNHETDCYYEVGEYDSHEEYLAPVTITCYCDKKFKVTPTVTLTMEEL